MGEAFFPKELQYISWVQMFPFAERFDELDHVFARIRDFLLGSVYEQEVSRTGDA